MGIKGAILGDIIGSIYEARPCSEPKTVPLFTWHNRFTDDSILTLAVKYAIDTDTDFATAFKYFGTKYKGRGFGPGFKMWLNGDPNFQASFGNGSAMRVSYIADVAKNEEELKSLVRESVKPTHDTPDGQDGAYVIAKCAYMAKNGASKKAIMNVASKYYPEIKNTPYNRLSYGWSATCRLSVPLAVRCFYDSTSFEDCMRKIIGIHCDADTVCAMAGCIAENYYGETVKFAEDILEYYLSPELFEVLIA